MNSIDEVHSQKLLKVTLTSGKILYFTNTPEMLEVLQRRGVTTALQEIGTESFTAARRMIKL